MRAQRAGIGILLRIAWVLLSIFVLGEVEEAAAQAYPILPPPINVNVPQLNYSSPYGPRQLEGKCPPPLGDLGVVCGVYQFHGGVDYSYDIGTPIYAVQGGTITDLSIDGGHNWYMSIAGRQTDPFPAARFSYLHLFDDSWIGKVVNGGAIVGPLPRDSEGNEIYGSTQVNVTILGQAVQELVTLELLGTEAGPSNCFAEIFWLDFAHDIANYALSACAGMPVGHLITTNTVSQGQLIAAVGKSGAAAPARHLHLQVNAGHENELLYVQHDNLNPPAYNNLNPFPIYKDKGDPTNPFEHDGHEPQQPQLKNGDPLDPTQDSPLIVRTEVNYAMAGHDLDEVQILMYRVGTPEPDLSDLANLDSTATACVNSHMCKDFNYGGTGHGLSVSRLHCDTKSPCRGPDGLPETVIQGGVYPQLHHGGVVDFLTDPIDLTTLVPDDYVILVRAFNIVGQSLENTIFVKISGPASVTADNATCTVSTIVRVSTAAGRSGLPEQLNTAVLSFSGTISGSVSDELYFNFNAFGSPTGCDSWSPFFNIGPGGVGEIACTRGVGQPFKSNWHTGFSGLISNDVPYSFGLDVKVISSAGLTEGSAHITDTCPTPPFPPCLLDDCSNVPTICAGHVNGGEQCYP